MFEWRQILADSARTGTIASTATAVAAAACGGVEDDEPVAPLNSVSHILWGDEAAEHMEPSAKYTLTGVALNGAAITGWAAIYHALLPLLRGRGRSVTPLAAAAGAVAVTGLAYVTDYHMVPARLTPGFEKRLSTGSMFAVYATLALGLTVGGLWSNRRS